MPVDRSHLKSAIAAMLDALTAVHPTGHQETYARRYVLTTRSGRRLELMFEQGPGTPTNLWFEAGIAGALIKSGTKHRMSPASALYAKPGKNGNPQYGRHSALETMPVLGKADLICMQPVTLAEAGAILDHLLGM